MTEVETQNPHWIGDYPAWDVVLPCGTIDKGVSMWEIKIVHQKMNNAGLLRAYEECIDFVRNNNISNYAKWRETNVRDIPIKTNADRSR